MNILDFLVPNQCVLCQKPHPGNLCSNCLTQLPRQPELLIKNSSKQIFHPTETTRTKSLDTSYLLSILSATEFRNPAIRKLIHSYKYQNLPRLSIPLSGLLLSTFTQHIRTHPQQLSSFIFCPIPLHPKRLDFRGYNQSELLTRHLANRLNIAIYKQLTRVKNTVPQMRTTHKDERQRNMKDSFFTSGYPQSPTLTIILIDDVTTTHSTLDAAAEALFQSGFRDIHALVIAH